MSEDYEVRGAHDDAVDHGAEHGEPLAQQIALFSAVLATIGAVVSLAGGHTQNDALYYKNEAVLLKAKASDDWAYYQAEEIKRHILEAAPGASAAKVADYAAKAKTLAAQARALDARSDDADAESRRALHPHVRLSVAMTFVQIAIALASITALTRRRWLFALAAVSAAIGTVLALVAWV